MSIDRRKDERKNFRMDNCSGKFIVTDQAGSVVVVNNVNDVSISGIGLQINETCFDVGDEIKLIYENDGLRIAINAAVRWCAYVSQSEGSRLGLQFEPGQGDMNLLFFMALREYLDAFDHEALMERL
jgi:hypothetical protein